MERLKLNEPNDRMWIGEPLKEQENCINYWLTSYRTFLEYLEMLRKRGILYWKEFEYVDRPVDLKPSDPRFNAALQTISQSLINK